ncbi:hypothetical protein Bbelb_133810 [Branchiostoma belcheri]|nr:hypothetical protein Bbelb_133810 [Branchiostoma belcheri]
MADGVACLRAEKAVRFAPAFGPVDDLFHGRILRLPPEEIDDQQDHNTEKLSRDTGVDSPGKKACPDVDGSSVTDSEELNDYVNTVHTGNTQVALNKRPSWRHFDPARCVTYGERPGTLSDIHR